jgi:FkbM family methyltransferase
VVKEEMAILGELPLRVRLKFYLTLLKCLLFSPRLALEGGVEPRYRPYFGYISSKTSNKKLLKETVTNCTPSPNYGHIARNIFLLNQRGQCRIDYDADWSLMIRKNGIVYTFELMIFPNPKARFVHNLTPFVDVFFSGVYDFYPVKSRTVVDVGGYLGETAIYFLKKGASKVCVYEPNPINFQYLVKNLKRNNSEDKIAADKRAVSVEKREMVVPDSGGAGSVFVSHESGMQVFAVDNVDPRDIIGNSQDILLKLDCKGCERELFELCKDILTARVRYIIVDAGRSTPAEQSRMQRLLEEAGFRLDKAARDVLYFSNDTIRASP